jgi:hypothetical protein
MGEQVSAKEKVARYLGLSKEGSPRTPQWHLPWWVSGVLAVVLVVGVAVDVAARQWWAGSLGAFAAVCLTLATVQRLRGRAS